MATNPRFGNDREAALADLRTSFGDTAGNAQELIDMHRASTSPNVREAMRVPVDEVATAEIDLDAIQDEYPSVTVLGAAVRGPWLSLVLQSPSGRTYKEAIPRGPKARTPRLKPEEAALHSATMARHEAQVEAGGIVADIERQVEEYRRRLLEEKLEDIQSGFSGIGDKARAAAEEAEREGDDGEDEPPAPLTRGDASESGGGRGQSMQTADPSGEDEGTGSDSGGKSETTGSDDGEDEPTWPREHKPLDALAKSNGVTFPENVTKVDEKIEFLQKQGVKPE